MPYCSLLHGNNSSTFVAEGYSRATLRHFLLLGVVFSSPSKQNNGVFLFASASMPPIAAISFAISFPLLFFAVFLLFAFFLVSTPRLCRRTGSLQELFLFFLSKVRIFSAVLRFLVFLVACTSKKLCRLFGIFCPAIPTQFCLLVVEESTGRRRWDGAVLVFWTRRVLCERFRLSCSNGAGLAPLLLRLRTGCLPEIWDNPENRSLPLPTR